MSSNVADELDILLIFDKTEHYANTVRVTFLPHPVWSGFKKSRHGGWHPSL